MLLLCTLTEDVNDEGEKEETKSHFDFGLFGNLNGNEYSGQVKILNTLHTHILEKN